MTKTTVTIDSFEIKDISEGLLTGPKGEFRFRVHIRKENSNKEYYKINKIVDLPSSNGYYSWKKGNHQINHKISINYMELKKGDTISVYVSGMEIDDIDDDYLDNTSGNLHEITPGYNDLYSITNNYYTMNYTVSSE